MSSIHGFGSNFRMNGFGGPGGSGGPGGAGRPNPARMRQMMAKAFERMDQNGDGQIGRDELDQVAQKISSFTGQQVSGDDLWQRMASKDTDGNGAVSKNELKNAALQARQNWNGASRFERGGPNLEAIAARISQATGQTVTVEQLQEHLSQLRAGGGHDLTDMANQAQNLHRQHLMRFRR